MLYSYQGNEPQELPERIKFPDGRTHYLTEGALSEEELSFAGWEGPIEQPPHTLGTEKLVWDSENSEYRVELLSDLEKEELWATRKAANSQRIQELKEIAAERKSQLTELGISTEAVDSFLALLSAAEFESINPFELRLPSVTLLGITPQRVAFQDPFEEWLKEHYESDLSHGYKVVLNQLEVTDPVLFAAHKQATINNFLADYLEEQFSALAYVSGFKDNFNGTGEVSVTALGSFDIVSVVLDEQEELVLEEGKALVKGRGRHSLKVTPITASTPCGKAETVEITLI